MEKKIKHKIEVRVKGTRYGEPGELLETIKRIPWGEAIGNFNPLFCRYRGKKMLILSKQGDLSDPLRRTKDYLEHLYIEITPPAEGSLPRMGVAGGSVRSDRKAAAARLNGLKGGRPKKKED